MYLLTKCFKFAIIDSYGSLSTKWRALGATRSKGGRGMEKMKGAWMLLLVAVVFAALAGCGSDTEIRYVCADENVGTIELKNGGKEQVWTFKAAADGSLLGAESGSIKIMPQDVEAVVLSSVRLGFGTNSWAKAPLAADGSASFSGLANADRGEVFILAKDGNTYLVKADEFEVSADRPMRFRFQSGSFEYGEVQESSMSLSLSGDGTYTLSADFGCDLVFGTKSRIADSSKVKQFAFLSKEGARFTASALRDAKGNISFAIPGISMSPLAEQLNMQGVSGDLVAVLEDGSQVGLEFDGSREDFGYVWYINGFATPNGYAYAFYDPQSGLLGLRHYEYPG